MSDSNWADAPTTTDAAEVVVLDPGRLLTVDQLAERWACSRSFIYQLLDEGLPSLKLGKARRFRPMDVDPWLLDRCGAGDAA